jgi:hypothetical protein
MNEIEQRLWAEAEAEANDWMSNVGFGVVSNMLSYMNPAQLADAIRHRTAILYREKVEVYNGALKT